MSNGGLGTLQVPGWRIEQKFNNKVLIGNWSEERRKFQRGNFPFGNSTQRVDFSNYGNYLPDLVTRRKAAMLNDGLERKFIFSHHGNCYSNNMISLYDQMMNKRELSESNLPPMRKWDRKSLSWVPEKTDHPLQGPPTNFGLLNKMNEKWQKESEEESIGVFHSTYGLSYKPYAPEAMSLKHYASSKSLSSHFVPHNVNKDLSFRNNCSNVAPEYPPNLVPTGSTKSVSFIDKVESP